MTDRHLPFLLTVLLYLSLEAVGASLGKVGNVVASASKAFSIRERVATQADCRSNARDQSGAQLSHAFNGLSSAALEPRDGDTLLERSGSSTLEQGSRGGDESEESSSSELHLG